MVIGETSCIYVAPVIAKNLNITLKDLRELDLFRGSCRRLIQEAFSVLQMVGESLVLKHQERAWLKADITHHCGTDMLMELTKL